MADRTYDVVTTDHEIHTIVASMVIENTNRGFEGGLVFRQGEKGSTWQVASFAPNSWLYYKAKDGPMVTSAIPPVEDRTSGDYGNHGPVRDYERDEFERHNPIDGA